MAFDIITLCQISVSMIIGNIIGYVVGYNRAKEEFQQDTIIIDGDKDENKTDQTKSN